MRPAENAKATVLVTRPVPLEQLRKYGSSKPLRRPVPDPRADQKNDGSKLDWGTDPCRLVRQVK